MNIKALRQAKADNDKRQADLKAEGRKLLAVEANARTPEQITRLDGIDVEMITATAEASTIATDLARAERYADDERNSGTPHVTVHDNATDKVATLGEIMQAMAFDSPDLPSHRRAMILPNGVAPHVRATLQAAVTGTSSGVPEAGGVLVRNEWNTSLLNRVQEDGKLAGRCFSMPLGEGSDGVEAPYVDETSRATGSRWGGVQVYRAAEAGTLTASQPKLGKFELRLEDLTGLFYATDRVLRDATLLESLAMKAFGSEFAFKLDDEILRGGGAGQCLGIIGNAPTVSVAKETGQAAGSIVYENIIKMYSRLLSRCMSGAEWFVNQTVWPQLFKMSLSVGTGGVPAFMPPGGASSSPYGSLMGLPVNVIEQAAAVGTVGDIILANFRNDYALISKPMTQASSIHVRFINNETTFRWVWPVIGKPVMSSVITPYKGSDTYGPFVTLATRA